MHNRDNIQRLRKHMKKHKLSYLDVTRLYGVTLPTVDKWLQSDSSEQFQEISDIYLDLLETRLKRPGWVEQEK